MANIAKRPDGRWRARYRDPAGKEHARHFARKLDARRWLDQVTASMVTGAYVNPKAGRITFTEYFADWAQRQVWESGTDRAVRLAAGSVTFGDIPLAALRRSHVERWVKAMQTASRGGGKPAGLAPGTIRTRVNNVRGVLRAAVRDRVIASDPSDGITLPRVRRPDVAMMLPTTAQVRALMGAAPDEWGAFVALCAFAGLRLGEAAAFQVADVDFLRRTLTVARQVQRGTGGQVEIRPPKYGSERTVYLADGLVRSCRRTWPRTAPAPILAAGCSVSARTCRRIRTRSATGGGRHARRPGAVRSSCTTCGTSTPVGLIAAGCDVVTVQRALGHASARVTLNTYAHLWPTAEDRTRAAAAAMLAETLSSADSVRTSRQA